jgi:hypothetical protein
MQDPLSGKLPSHAFPLLKGRDNDFTFDSVADLRAVLNQGYDPGAIESLISELAVSGSADFGITVIEKMDPKSQKKKRLQRVSKIEHVAAKSPT